MRAQDRKFRLALAVLEQGVDLGRVVAAFMKEDIPLDRIGLMVCEQSRDRLSLEANRRGSRTSPLATLDANLRPIVDSVPLLYASPCLIDPWREKLHLPALWSEGTETDSGPRLAPDLERHLKAGSAIIAAQSLTPRQQWQCMRVLLQQSSAAVLGLECSLPPAESTF